jgi:hypothetical protein
VLQLQATGFADAENRAAWRLFPGFQDAITSRMSRQQRGEYRRGPNKNLGLIISDFLINILFFETYRFGNIWFR